MKKNVSEVAKPHPFMHISLFRISGILLVLTMLSTWMICGMYARYTTSDTTTETAKVSAFGNFTLTENKTVAINDITEMINSNSIYQINNETVSKNEYKYVVPGVDIPKNPYIVLSEKNETSCMLFVEVKEINFPVDGTITFEMSDNWTKINGTTGKNGGTVYYYKNIIEPNKKYDKIEILKENKISVSQYFSEESVNADSFELDFYGYLIQTNSETDFENLYKNCLGEGE